MQRWGILRFISVSSPRVVVIGTIEVFHINWQCSWNSANFTKAMMCKLGSI